jgi:hypothetical protein
MKAVPETAQYTMPPMPPILASARLTSCRTVSYILGCVAEVPTSVGTDTAEAATARARNLSLENGNIFQGVETYWCISDWAERRCIDLSLYQLRSIVRIETPNLAVSLYRDCRCSLSERGLFFRMQVAIFRSNAHESYTSKRCIQALQPLF